jgi:hypothetical protein
MTHDTHSFDAQPGMSVEDIMALALRGADIQFLVVDLDDGRRITLDALDGDIATWRMTDGVRTMLQTVRLHEDGTVAETLSTTWLS